MGAAGDRTGGSRPVSLWLALAAGPAAWGAYVLTAWFLVPVACERGLELILHVFAAGALLAALAGLLLGLRVLQSGRGSDRVFLAPLGAMLSAFFAVGILFAWIFVVFVDPCR